MVNEELIQNIKARFQEGQKATDIKEALMYEGYSDGDIEAAFAHIRHDAFMQIPLYAKIHNWMTDLDHRAANFSTKTVIHIYAAIFLMFVGLVIVLYFFLDPLGIRTSQRDEQREQIAIELREALEKYQRDNRQFPASFNQLVPKYIEKVPVDPKSKSPFEYKTFDNNFNYEFCVEFEVQNIRCITSSVGSEIPVVLPQVTEAPVQVVYAINGQVFVDTDEDGDKSEQELGREGVAITISNNINVPVCETTTDSSGLFNCNVPGVGLYNVNVTVPKGFTSDLGNPVKVTLPNDENPQPNVETMAIGLIQ